MRMRTVTRRRRRKSLSSPNLHLPQRSCCLAGFAPPPRARSIIHITRTRLAMHITTTPATIRQIIPIRRAKTSFST
jgi:hypothetical protein